MMENPCEKCDRKETCRRPGLEGTDYTLVECGTVCEDYARYLGYAEGQAERDMLRKALEKLAKLTAIHIPCMTCVCRVDGRCDRDTCWEQLVRWAISEAGKEVGG